jgi:AcrR family transcriptional regulator
VTLGQRDRNKLKTRDALIRASLTLGKQHGFDAITVDAIVDRCGVSPRTFFRYFPTKAAVFLAELDERHASLMDALDAQPFELSALDALDAALRLASEDWMDARAEIRAREALIKSSPALRIRAVEYQQQFHGEVVAALTERARADGLSNLELRLVVVAKMAALQVAVEEWIRADDSGDLMEFIDMALRTIRHGAHTR